MVSGDLINHFDWEYSWEGHVGVSSRNFDKGGVPQISGYLSSRCEIVGEFTDFRQCNSSM